MLPVPGPIERKQEFKMVWVELVLKYHMQHRTRRINLCENLHFIHYHLSSECVSVYAHRIENRYIQLRESFSWNHIWAVSFRGTNSEWSVRLCVSVNWALDWEMCFLFCSKKAARTSNNKSCAGAQFNMTNLWKVHVDLIGKT